MINIWKKFRKASWYTQATIFLCISIILSYLITIGGAIIGCMPIICFTICAFPVVVVIGISEIMDGEKRRITNLQKEMQLPKEYLFTPTRPLSPPGRMK